jgi:hypothetical protein
MNLQFVSPFKLTVISLGTVALLAALVGVEQTQSYFNSIDIDADAVLSENTPVQPAAFSLEEPIAPASGSWCDGRLQDCPI